MGFLPVTLIAVCAEGIFAELFFVYFISFILTGRVSISNHMAWFMPFARKDYALTKLALDFAVSIKLSYDSGSYCRGQENSRR